MAHYAKLDNPNTDITTVLEVIVADQEFIDSGTVGSPDLYLQTSYNTRGGVHYGADGQPDGGVALRANYAGIGYVYDKPNDVFYAPQPYPSWTISAPTWIWQPPVLAPTDGKMYEWDETTLSWVQINP